MENTEVRISIEDVISYINTNKREIDNIGIISVSQKSDKKKEFQIYDENKCDSESKSEVEIETSILEINHVQKIKTLPQHLKSLFGDFISEFIHMGVISKLNDESNKNISFFSSILCCLKQSFNELSISDQKKYLIKFFDEIKQNIFHEGFTKFKYAQLKWDKNSIHNDISLHLVTKYIIRYIADYFHINIFLLDLVNDITYYTGGDFVPYKKNIFLLRYDNDHFEPLFTAKSKYMTFGDDIIKHLIKNKEYVQTFNLNNKKDSMPLIFLPIEEDLANYIDLSKIEYTTKKGNEDNNEDNKEEEIIEDDTKTNGFDDNPSDDDSEEEQTKNIFGEKKSLKYDDLEKSVEKNIKYNLNKKMLLDDLQKLAVKLDIPISIKDKKTGKNINKTKIVLYNELDIILNGKKL